MTPSSSRTRIQQSSTSSPNTSALQAAARSFSKKPPPFPRQVPSTHYTNTALAGSQSNATSSPAGKVNINGSSPLLAAQQSFLKEQTQKYNSQFPTDTRKSLLYSSPSLVAANLAAERLGNPLKNGVNLANKGDEEVLPAKGTVDARRKLFQHHDVYKETSSPPRIASVRAHGVSSTHSRSSSLEFQVASETSPEEIPVLENVFEKNTIAAWSTPLIPALHSPKTIHPITSPDKPSLTAAILATQLSPPNPAQNSRCGSPLPKSVSTSGHGSPAQKVFYKNPSFPDNLSMLSLPPTHDATGVSRTGASISSNTSETSHRNGALLAATLASNSKGSSSSQTKPPKPPPPRKAKTHLRSIPTVSNDGISIHGDSDTLPPNSTATGYSKYHTAHSSVSLKYDRLSAPTASITHISSARSPPLQPTGRRSGQQSGARSSTALTAAVLSVASPRNSYSSFAHPDHDRQDTQSISQHQTGDSVTAASLAPSRVVPTTSKKLPVPPAPRRGRRKSPPLPLKIGFRETMRKPPKIPLKEISPSGRTPRLVKHHPHKHSEGERRRWRHFVTESERKRYEGLWAANKGLFLANPNNDVTATASPSLKTRSHSPHNPRHVWSSTPNYMEVLVDCVDSLVVRDIWARSRLPFDYLGDIWDLVDRGEKGHLSRDEFLVGTWLIDQSLKGRKLPLKVQDEAWQSVRRLGVKLQPVSANNNQRREGS